MNNEEQTNHSIYNRSVKMTRRVKRLEVANFDNMPSRMGMAKQAKIDDRYDSYGWSVPMRREDRSKLHRMAKSLNGKSANCLVYRIKKLMPDNRNAVNALEYFVDHVNRDGMYSTYRGYRPRELNEQRGYTVIDRDNIIRHKSGSWKKRNKLNPTESLQNRRAISLACRRRKKATKRRNDALQSLINTWSKPFSTAKIHGYTQAQRYECFCNLSEAVQKSITNPPKAPDHTRDKRFDFLIYPAYNLKPEYDLKRTLVE